MFRRILPIIMAAFVGIVLVAWQADRIWRAAYPSLPRRVQAAPYRLRSRLSFVAETPVALPTVGVPVLTGRSGHDRATLPASGDRASSVPGIVALSSVPAVMNTAEPTAEAVPNLPSAAALDGVRHEYQTWNNCGPATISMVLSYYGASEGQAQAARRLKPDPDDKNVGPVELARYAREMGFDATVRVNGDLGTLRMLLALGLPVVAETWFVPEPGDEMGHYRVLTGYADDQTHFVAQDSYNGPDAAIDYEAFDGLWRVFNRTYLVVYPSELAASVSTVLGADMDDGHMYVKAVQRAQHEVATIGDGFAWFNLGTSLLGLGDTAGAARAFDEARSVNLPWRMLWYQFGPFEAYAAQGRWDDVAALADANLRNADNLEESHYWRGRALAASGDSEGARAAWQRARQLNPLFGLAEEALVGPAP